MNNLKQLLTDETIQVLDTAPEVPGEVRAPKPTLESTYSIEGKLKSLDNPTYYQ